MKVIATLPSLHREKLLEMVALHPLVDAVRFNTGMKVHLDYEATLEKYLKVSQGKEFYLDLKGRQLRIAEWAHPTFGDIGLNHEIEVDTPTKIYFRGDEKTNIAKVNGNKIFLDPPPPKAVGAGQSVNIIDPSLKIKGYFTNEDLGYIEAAKNLGIKNFMLSFVEEESEILELENKIPNANIIAKIESVKGISFLTTIFPTLRKKPTLMAARDDLYIQLGDEKSNIFKALELMIQLDKNAILASRLFTSLEKSEEVELSDLSDFKLMQNMGYNNFLLSDGLCSKEQSFLNAMEIIKHLTRNW